MVTTGHPSQLNEKFTLDAQGTFGGHYLLTTKSDPNVTVTLQPTAVDSPPAVDIMATISVSSAFMITPPFTSKISFVSIIATKADSPSDITTTSVWMTVQ